MLRYLGCSDCKLLPPEVPSRTPLYICEERRTFTSAWVKLETHSVIFHLKLLSLVEGESSLSVLLTPLASMVGITHHGPGVSVGVEARVHVQGEVILAVAHVDDKTTGKEEESKQTEGIRNIL